MARKKKAYYELKKFLEDDQGFGADAAVKLADDIYDIWLQDEKQNIMEIFNARIEEELDEETIIPDYVETAEQADRKLDIDKIISEAKKEPEVRRVKPEDLENIEEKAHDQNLEENLIIKPDAEYKNPYKEEIEKPKTGPATSVPTKFDWEKYLEENPQFKTKDKENGTEVLLLQFFKDIAHKEGFLSVRYSSLGNADQGYCGVSCEMEWPNLPRISSGLADAHFNNCHSFTKYYLSPMAENRSFIRAVKQYFNIPYLGKDEIGQTPKEEPKSEEAPTGPYVTLKKAAKDKLNIASFDGFKSFLRKQVKENPETAWLQPEEYQDWVDYNDWDEIKKPKILELIGKIKA